MPNGIHGCEIVVGVTGLHDAAKDAMAQGIGERAVMKISSGEQNLHLGLRHMHRPQSGDATEAGQAHIHHQEIEGRGRYGLEKPPGTLGLAG